MTDPKPVIPDESIGSILSRSSQPIALPCRQLEKANAFLIAFHGNAPFSTIQRALFFS
jgi:hypothetical protein